MVEAADPPVDPEEQVRPPVATTVAAMLDLRHEWSPTWAPHVIGMHSDRDPDSGDSRWAAVCSFPGCGGEWQGTCPRGRPREKIARFALQHRHEGGRG